MFSLEVKLQTGSLPLGKEFSLKPAKIAYQGQMYNLIKEKKRKEKKRYTN